MKELPEQLAERAFEAPGYPAVLVWGITAHIEFQSAGQILDDVCDAGIMGLHPDDAVAGEAQNDAVTSRLLRRRWPAQDRQYGDAHDHGKGGGKI